MGTVSQRECWAADEGLFLLLSLSVMLLWLFYFDGVFGVVADVDVVDADVVDMVDVVIVFS